MSSTNRYSDLELATFNTLIEEKIKKTQEDLNSLLDKIQNISENMSESGDRMDETTNNSEMEMLHLMANRQRKYKQDLENALLRIRNKSYGICIITGELIDKRRLIAVPTTTKSLAAKNALAMPEKKPAKAVSSSDKNKPNKIISKVIRKNTPKVSDKHFIIVDDDEDEDEDDLLNDVDLMKPFNFDEIIIENED